MKPVDFTLTLIWRKLWANPLFYELGKKFIRLEAWPYVKNVLATGTDDPDAGYIRGSTCHHLI
jgi:hypothetical protein